MARLMQERGGVCAFEKIDVDLRFAEEHAAPLRLASLAGLRIDLPMVVHWQRPLARHRERTLPEQLVRIDVLALSKGLEDSGHGTGDRFRLLLEARRRDSVLDRAAHLLGRLLELLVPGLRLNVP